MNEKTTPPLSLEERVRIVMENPSTENLEALWMTVFVRKAWYFLPASEGETTPMVINEGDEVTLPIFTSFQKMDNFAKSQNIINQGDELPTLVLSPYEAMVKVQEVAQHLTSVAFNAGDEAHFKVPPDTLIKYAERFGVFDFKQ